MGLLAGGVVLAGTATASAPAQAVGVPVDPLGGAVYFAASTARQTQLYAGVQTGRAIDFTVLGEPTPTGEDHQGLAFRASDRMLYAVEAYEGFHLLRIDGSGAIEKLGVLSDMAAVPYVVGGGTFGEGAYADTYLAAVMDRSGEYRPSHLLKIDIAEDGTFTEGRTPLSLPDYAVLADITPSQGFLWGIFGQEIFRIDPVDGAAEWWTLPEGTVGPGTDVRYGNAWTLGNGQMSFGTNAGEVIQLRVDHPTSAAPTFTVMARHTVPRTDQNDATYVPAVGPVDLAVVSNAPASVAPGAEVGYSVTITNGSSFSSSGATVAATLPETLTDLVLPAECYVEVDRVLCGVGYLAPSASTSFVISGTASTAGGDVTGTFLVEGNDVDDDAGNNTASVTTAIVPPARVVDSAFAVSAGTRAADGHAYHTATVTVMGADGLPLVGKAVAFAGTAGAVLSRSTTVTGPDGSATVEVRSTTATTHQIVAVVDGVQVGSPLGVTFVAGPDSSLVSPPGIYPTNGSHVSGTGVPGQTITVTYPDGTTAETTVAAEGTWHVPAPTTLVHGDVLGATATNAAGKVSELACTAVDQVAPEVMVDLSNGMQINGSGLEAGDAATVVDPDGKKIPGTLRVDDDGTFVFTPQSPLTQSDRVFVVVTDAVGNVGRHSVLVESAVPFDGIGSAVSTPTDAPARETTGVAARLGVTTPTPTQDDGGGRLARTGAGGPAAGAFGLALFTLGTVLLVARRRSAGGELRALRKGGPR